jgi:hypothetical protein
MENEFVDVLRSVVKALVIQEVRYLRTEQACPSPFVLGEMRRSIQETKDRVRALTRSMDPHERNLLIKRIVDQSVEEEIDEAIEARKNRCLRCIHIRYFDETGAVHFDLPYGVDREGACDVSTLQICCENPSIPGTSCNEFAERLGALPLEEYLSEIRFYYEVREMLDRLDEIWEEYLNR